MSTERFSKTQFEAALDDAFRGTGVQWLCDGILKSEFHYHAIVKQTKTNQEVSIEIQSSIDGSGFAADTGENSIRVWVMGSGKPMFEKEQAYVTRVAGWAERMRVVIAKQLEKAQSVPFCPKCGGLMRLRTRRDGGKFWGCIRYPECSGSMDATPESKPTTQPTATQPPVTAQIASSNPACPRCGRELRKRVRRSDNKPFWGCSGYPACNFACDLDALPTAKPADPVAQPTKIFKPSHYQLAVFDWVSRAAKAFEQVAAPEAWVRALVVEARAGSGKTTTGVQMMKLLPRTLDILFCTFNNHVQQDIAKKAPAWVSVRTYHSLGYAACRAQWGNDVEIDEDKVDRHLRQILDYDQFRTLYPVVRQLVGLVKANLTGTTYDELAGLVDHHGIETNGDQDIIFEAVAKVIVRCANETKLIDYDDMCWLPVYHNIPCHQYDFIFVDEAQDTNRCQIALALMSIKDTGIIVATGDRFQSLYGFRGADADAIPNLINELKADVLPLSITYRNPRVIVNLTNEKFPWVKLEAAEDAEEGILRDLGYEDALNEYKPGDMVLCRCNAPLVEPAFELIRRGIKAIIRGRDIGKNLVTLIDKMKARDLEEMLTKLYDYQQKEVTKLLASEKNNQAQLLKDKVETIIAIANGVASIAELKGKINAIFSDDVEGVVFSSVHKAKGLEAKNVFILNPELMPHPMAKKEWEKQQELNIEYVAITRTLHQLVYVH